MYLNLLKIWTFFKISMARTPIITNVRPAYFVRQANDVNKDAKTRK